MEKLVWALIQGEIEVIVYNVGNCMISVGVHWCGKLGQWAIDNVDYSRVCMSSSAAFKLLRLALPLWILVSNVHRNQWKVNQVVNRHCGHRHSAAESMCRRSLN